MSDLESSKYEVNKGFKNPSKLINDYHYIFWSHKNYKISLSLNIIRWVLILIALFSIMFSLYSIGFINRSIDLSYYLIGVIVFFASAISAAYTSLYIRNVINEQILENCTSYHKKNISESRISEMSCWTRTHYIFSMKSKLYVEEIRKDWINKELQGVNKIEFARFVSSWQQLKTENNIEKKIRIRDFIHKSNNNYNVYIIALFSLCSLIIVDTGDANIFYQLFTIVGLKYFLLLFILGFEVYFIISIAGLMAGGLMNNYDDFINDQFKIDSNPSDLRVKRFINALLNYNMQDCVNYEVKNIVVTKTNPESERIIEREFEKIFESKLEKRFESKLEKKFEGSKESVFESTVEESFESIIEKKIERENGSNTFD